MSCKSRRLRVLSLWIASIVLLQTVAAGQSGSGLAIQILEAKPGQNLIAQELPPMKVRVLDRTGRALSGANVLFVAPEEGPTGQFLPDASQVNIATDAEGMATTPRFRTNSEVGDYQIQVVASYKTSSSRVIIPQSNVLKRKSSSKKIMIITSVIGGAAAAALAARGGNSGPASSALGALATPTLTLGGESPVGISTPTLAAPPPASTTSVVTPSGTSLVNGATSPSTGATVSPIEVVQPVASTPPPVSIVPTPSPISSVCALMPVKSNKKDCR